MIKKRSLIILIFVCVIPLFVYYSFELVPLEKCNVSDVKALEIAKRQMAAIGEDIDGLNMDVSFKQFNLRRFLQWLVDTPIINRNYKQVRIGDFRIDVSCHDGSVEGFSNINANPLSSKFIKLVNEEAKHEFTEQCIIPTINKLWPDEGYELSEMSIQNSYSDDSIQFIRAALRKKCGDKKSFNKAYLIIGDKCELRGMTNELFINCNQNNSPELTKDEALLIAKKAISKDEDISESDLLSGDLYLYNKFVLRTFESNETRLAWVFGNGHIAIDAINGDVLWKWEFGLRKW